MWSDLPVRIEVLEVIDAAEGRIRFAHRGVEAVGWWHSRHDAEPGWFHVELDAPDPLEWGRDIVASSSEPGCPVLLAGEGEAVVLTGELLEMGGDGVGVVSLGESSLTILTMGGAPAGVTGQRVSLTVVRLDLFPYAI